MPGTKSSIDQAYSQACRELEHNYGANYHILSEPLALTLLAKLSKPSTVQPEISYLVRELYSYLVRDVVSREFATSTSSIATRMAATEPERGVWAGPVINSKQRAVTVNLARAGSLPSQTCFEFLNRILEPDLVRQDHVVMARTVDAQQHVTGAHFGDSKIGGSIDDAIVLFPDPMGATGSSLIEAVNHYRSHGKATKIIALNLIITPDYLRALKTKAPDVIVYALRLDRGASNADILATKPGTHWEKESGLTPIQYIIPGAGGLGEIMNNSYC